jgi:hypothetical protein
VEAKGEIIQKNSHIKKHTNIFSIGENIKQKK